MRDMLGSTAHEPHGRDSTGKIGPVQAGVPTA